MVYLFGIYLLCRKRNEKIKRTKLEKERRNGSPVSTLYSRKRNKKIKKIKIRERKKERFTCIYSRKIMKKIKKKKIRNRE